MTDFQSLQRQFAAFIRDPHNTPPPPGCDAARMQHYHQLFFNNFDGVLELAYPRLCAEVGAAPWLELTRLFFQTVPQHSPYLSDVPAQFAEFLDAQTAQSLSDGQIELAAFELACFELKTADDEPRRTDEADQPPQGAALKPTWVINPDTILFESLYPVHDPNWDPRGTAQTPTFLVLVRDPAGLVQTYAVSLASARLLHLIHAHPWQPLAVVIDALAQELNQPAARLLPLAQQQITQWFDAHVLLAAGVAG
ncbi:MAG: DNA-binding domain-containing protein [Halothiobacillus sp.]